MDFSNYIFRSHMVGKIINLPKVLTDNQKNTLHDYTLRAGGEGRKLTANQEKVLIELKYKYNKSQEYSLTDGSKKVLAELAYSVKHGRTTELNSEMITKGLATEKNCRDILSRVSGLFLTASTERKQNKWVTGAIDVEPNNVIIDIKSAWSWESFAKILESSANEIYLRQGDSYMDLWQKKDFLLCHVLTDTPNLLVEKKIKSLDYKHDILNVEGDVREDNIPDVKKIISNHIFSRKALEEFCEFSSNIHIEWFSDFNEIPESERVHMIPHIYDPERIEQRNKCISMAREYMNTVTAINNFQPQLIQ
ncbi:hypothetical protein [Tenacibaculum piscium]|uniref:hypothetical protein n=1 Tax=Tenacibaculum piscium TaxID=1458515 RepID=UPI001F400633|nr:hypothetical protein [Tenacibaculum piscium]